MIGRKANSMGFGQKSFGHQVSVVGSRPACIATANISCKDFVTLTFVREFDAVRRKITS
jgi:hypothetical protein